MLLLQFDRLGCYSGSLDLRLGGAVFESRSGHWLYLVFSCFYLISLVTCRDIIAVTVPQSFSPIFCTIIRISIILAFDVLYSRLLKHHKINHAQNQSSSCTYGTF